MMIATAQPVPIDATRGSKAKTILVTGGAGFIGSSFVRRMHARYPNYRIVVIDALTYAGNLENFGNIPVSDRFAFHYGDIRNHDLLERLVSEADIVVHFAAESHVTRSIADTSSAVSTDVVGTATLASAVVRYQSRIERFIHISTSEVYGSSVAGAMDEDHPLLPASPYAGAKAGADRLMYSFWNTWKLPIVIVRPFNNYGPHQHLEKLVPRLITSILLGEPVPLHGDGSAARDWVFVEDHVEALDTVLHAPIDKIAGEVFNIGSGKPTSILEVAQVIARQMGADESAFRFLTNRPGQVQLHWADAGKIASVLGYRTTTSIEDGLAKTIAWYRENRAMWTRQMWLREIEVETAAGKIVH
ncbi:MAG: dTDP-glucose 4,6-dehydratase [Candidatus Velthaea sp.]